MNVSQNVLRAARTPSLVVALFAACLAPAMAQMSASGAPAQMTAADRAFVTSMLQISREQVALANLAAQRTSDPNAVASADRTAADWAAFRSHLAPLAAAAGVASPVSLSAAQQAMLTRLQHATSTSAIVMSVKFERQEDQQAAAQLRAEKSSTNPQITEFVAYAQPVLSGYENRLAAETWPGPTRSGAYAWK